MKVRKLRPQVEKKLNNENWWLIIAKNKRCQGYGPGETKEEACEKFGIKVEECSIKRVIKTDKGFIEPDQYVQGKLL